MCGRYTLFTEEVEVLKEYGIEPINDYKRSYNVAPGQNVLAIIHNGTEKRAGHLRWGLVPSWAKDEKIGYKMINARSETAHVKPSFKNLMAKKRCLIVADSFYEWKQTDQSKQPQRIQVTGRKLFAFAGLWDKWKRNGKVLFTCTMLTKGANEFMSEIHHRMPIILPKEQEDEWITPHVWKPMEAKTFLEQIKTEKMTAYPVGTYVNKASNNDESCITPLIN